MRIPVKRKSTILLEVLIIALCCLIGINNCAAQVDTINVCVGESALLRATPNFSIYEWSPSSNLTGQGQSVAVVSPVTSGLYTVSISGSSTDNLATNGDFSAGNTGFTTDYTYVPGGTFNQGSYAILSNPRLFNNAFAQCDDPTTPNGEMYVADGSIINGDEVWCQSISGLDPTLTYAFSAQVTTLVTSNPPRLAFSINGQRIGDQLAATSTPCQWLQFYSTWEANGSTTAQLCIENTNTTPNGNDFALDDIRFVPLTNTFTDSFFVNIIQPTSTRLTPTLCRGQRYTQNGFDILAGDSATTVLSSQFGCDSIVSVVTTIADTTFTQERVDSLCPGEVLVYNGWQINADTVLCETLTSFNGCDSVFCLTVKYFDESAISFTDNQPTCQGFDDGSLLVSTSAGVPPFTYRWDDGSFSAFRQNLPAGTYAVTVTDAKGCTTSASINLNEPPVLVFDDILSIPTRCFNESNGIILTNGTGGTPPYITTIRNGANTLDFQSLRAGTYTVHLEDSLGCNVEQEIEVTQPSQVRAELSGDTFIKLGQIARHQGKVFGDSVIARWSFNGIAIDSLVMSENLTWQPPSSGNLMLRGIDENGCEDIATLLIELEPVNTDFFPTAFSPNGDGVNDFFAPYPSPAIDQLLEFKIFDRWGGIRYSTTNCSLSNFRACGWDGGKREGDPLDSGVFVYYARILLINGEVYEQTGDVTMFSSD